jgi:predicted metal-dependent HD superfamily phosphohydrolase
MTLQKTFIELVQKYSKDLSLVESLLDEIEKSYTSKKRFYHTLSHLENLLQQLLEVKNKIQNWDSVLFAMYYHDIVYKASKSDNENKSAEVAKQRLHTAGVPTEIINKCVSLILATKDHSLQNDIDTNLFTDADLSILGQSWELYEEYFKQVRKEYSVYPDFMYNPGRKKVIHHFLNMNRIFKTDEFFNKYEEAARKNLAQELKLL